MVDILNKRRWPNPVYHNPDTGQVDAFNRIKVGNPHTLFDSKQLHNKLPLFWDESITNTSGNATSTHSSSNASTILHVETNDTIIRQTYTHWNYEPGKSQEIIFTGLIDLLTGEGNGVTARMGLFTEFDGIFFEYSNQNLYLCVRKNGNYVHKIPQSDWNYDRMDGTGVSGININIQKAQIFYIDYEWLGVGDIRFGVFEYGRFHLLHQIYHANELDNPYMSTPNLPVRYEISTTNESANLNHICSTVITNGNILNNGFIHTASTSGTVINAVTAGTIYPVLGVRLNQNKLDAFVKLQSVSLLNTGNANFEYLIVVDPTLSSSATFTPYNNSAVDVAIGTGITVTNNSWTISPLRGFASDRVANSNIFETIQALGSKIDGTPIAWWLCVKGLQNNANIHGTLQWIEYL